MGIGHAVVATSMVLTATGMADPTPGAALAPPAGYGLVWQDEFDGDSPAPDRWKHDTARNRAGWYNREQQYYASAGRNAWLENGKLVIEARYEPAGLSHFRDWGGQRYSSARLTTRGRASWHRGFFEVRAKMPCARGAWPAIWLFPDGARGAWEGGEIDLAELVGHHPGTVFQTVHTAQANPRHGVQVQSAAEINGCGQFHDYQLLWTKDRIVMGVDGHAYLETPSDQFDRRMSLILNVAVGGTWGGQRGIDDPAFPVRMEVDHVRIWQEGART